MNTKIIIGVFSILAISLAIYFFTKKSSPSCKKYNYSSIKSSLTGKCLNAEQLDLSKINPPEYRSKIPSGTNAVNRQPCNDQDSQKWLFEDQGKIKNLKTGQYLYSDDTNPGWAALGDINNQNYKDFNFEWDVNSINSVNNLQGISIGDPKIKRTIQDNPQWTHLIFNPSSTTSKKFDEEVWNVYGSKQVCI